jgi:hypothetical protein
MRHTIFIAFCILVGMPLSGQALEQGAIDSLMILDFEAFDQDMKGGWRYYSNQMEFGTAATLIEHYLENHPELEDHNRQVMHWHAGQMLAMDGQDKKAVVHMEKSRKEEDVMMWNEYLDATVAFLKKDRQNFDTNLKAVEAMTNNPNLPLLKILEANFDKSYRKALESAMKQ